MTVQEFALPDLGEGLTESELVSWEVAVGDMVELNQILAEVETAKALVELPSPFAGRIERLMVEPGTSVRVGTPIVAIETADAADQPRSRDPQATPEPAGQAAPEPAAQAAPEPAPEPAAQEAPKPERTSVLVGYGPRVASDERPRRRERRADWVAGHRVAEDEQALQHPQVTQSCAVEDVRTPITGVRRRMAEAMVQSAFTAPHASVHLTVDVTASLAVIERLREHPRFSGHRIGILTLVARSCLIALRESPAINSRWDDSVQEVVTFVHVNLGIAAATERGLLVPNIRGADRLSFVELADAITETTTAARQATTTPAQLSGGTFTITNVGVFGVDGGTPILPPGEAAILAVGAVRRRPWEHEGELALRDVLTLTLSFDHRLVDGREASEFVAAVGEILSDPSLAIAL